jgi:cardiolipin synthase
MNLPNVLSVFRLFVTAFFILLAAYGHFRLALALFVLQAISDLLDGFFARRMGAKTTLGAYLDPLADKVMLASSYIVLSVQGIIPYVLTVVVIVRDIVISAGFLLLLKKGLKVSPAPSFISKTTTVFQMLTVVYVLWSGHRSFESFFVYVTGLRTLVSGLQYIFIGGQVLFRKETA